MTNEAQNSIQCSNCGTLNPPGATFCLKCKTELNNPDALPEWLVNLSMSETPNTPEPLTLSAIFDNPTPFAPKHETPIEENRPTEIKGSTSELPEWLRDIPVSSNDLPKPKTPEIAFRTGTSGLDGVPLFDPNERLQPFELDPHEKGLDTNNLKMPKTEDLSGGVPDWLKELTGSSTTNSPSKETAKPRSVLDKQPVFETVQENQTPGTGQLPEWLKEEDAPQAEPAVQTNVPNWLRPTISGTSNAEIPGMVTTDSSHKYRDDELDKMLEQAFDDDAPGATTREFLSKFDLEELPGVNEPSGLTTRPPELRGLTAELRAIPGLSSVEDEEEEEFNTSDIPPLEKLFTEVTDDFSSQVVRKDKLTGFLKPVTGTLPPLDDLYTPTNTPIWGSGLAPWLVGLPLPSIVEPSIIELDLPVFNLPEEDEAVIGRTPTPTPSMPTRPFSTRDLLRQTDELLAETADKAEEEYTSRKFNTQDIAPFSDEELAQAQEELPKIGEEVPSTGAPRLTISVPKTNPPNFPPASPLSSPLGFDDDDDDEFELIGAPEPELTPFAVGEDLLGDAPHFGEAESKLPKIDGDTSLPDWFDLKEPDPTASQPGQLGSGMSAQISAFTPNIGASEASEWNLPKPAADEAPDWLSSLGATAAPPVKTPAPAKPEIDYQPDQAVEEMPDWLRSSLGGTSFLKEATLSDVSTSSSSPPTESDSFASIDFGGDRISSESWKAEEVPDWLQSQLSQDSASQVRPATPEFSLESIESASTDKEEVPAWMMQTMGVADKLAEKPPKEKVPLADTSSDDWLQQLGLEEATPSPVVSPEPDWLKQGVTINDIPAKADEDVPSWLAKMGSATNVTMPEESALPDWKQGATVNDIPAKIEEDVPSWLKNMGTAQAPAPQTKPEDEEDSSPDWLQEAAAEAEEPAPIEGDVPSWLAKMGSGQVPAATKPAEPIQPAKIEESVPNWLEAMGSATALPQEDVEVPDWLTADSEPKAAEPNTGQVPDWLVAFGQGQKPGRDPSKAPTSYSSSVVGAEMSDEKLSNLPDWLKAEGTNATQATSVMPSPTVEDSQATIPLPKVEKPVISEKPAISDETDSEISALLRDLGAADNENTAVKVPEWLQTQPNANNLGLGDDIPNWLQEGGEEIQPSSYTEGLFDDQSDKFAEQIPKPGMETEPVQPIQSQNISPSFFDELDAPSWLRGTQAKPVELSKPAEPTPNTPEQMPTWLRSIHAPVAEEPQPDATKIPVFGTTTTVTTPEIILPPSLASAALLNSLVVEKPGVSQVPSTQPKKTLITPSMLVRWGVFLILLAMALLGALITPLTADVTVTPSVQSFYNSVQALQNNQKVLMVFDWEADKIAEMRPLSQAVSQHVMSQRARLIALSTNPQGAILANQILEPLATKPEYGNSTSGLYEYGRGYLNLGWRPGDVAAIRGLFNNLAILPDYQRGFEGKLYPAMEGINSINDFDMIVVLVGDETSLRTWIEQLQLSTSKQVLLVTPMSVKMFAKPYAAAPPAANPDISTRFVRAQGLIGGLEDAVQYQKLLLDNKGLIIDQNLNLNTFLTAQTLAVFALIILVVFGNIVYLIVRKR